MTTLLQRQPELGLGDEDLLARRQELSLAALMQELEQSRRPPWILRQLMNHLEERRQARGLGWSRPWNKQGMTIFRSHRQNLQTDQAYFEPLWGALEGLIPTEAHEERAFLTSLRHDSQTMAFTFYHAREEAGQRYEGLTLSLGRRVPHDASKRDRLDLILEDRCQGSQVDGRLDLVRLYVCPWDRYRSDRAHTRYTREVTPDGFLEGQALYSHAVQAYHVWKLVPARQWTHWSARLIDYFGARSFIPQGTAFS